MDIKNYTHKFNIDGLDIEIEINFINGLWQHNVTKGETGMSGSSGGVYSSIYEYIEYAERAHRYSFRFFNYGYHQAKQMCEK